jgi:CBS domain-containing protein
MPKSIREILKSKGSAVWSIGPDATVLEALKLMEEKGIGAVLVMEAGKIAGILSERDYARKVVLKGKTSAKTRVREIMTAKVFAVSQEQSVEECMALMTASRIRHLPVLEGDRVIGMISIGDVVKAVIEEQQFAIDQLNKYITGSL